MEPEIRKPCEHALLKTYLNTLVEQGVQNYSFEQAHYDYRLSMLTHLLKLIRFFDSFDIVNERHRKVHQAIRRRIPAAVIDNYGDDLINP